jgi:hypothetical protein
MERIRSRSASSWVLAFVLVVAVGVLVAPAVAIGGTLTGIHGLLEDHDWEPVAGARVELFAKGAPPTPIDSVVTTESGRFYFHPAAGTYWLKFSDPQERYSTYWYLDEVGAICEALRQTSWSTTRPSRVASTRSSTV